MDRFRFWTRAHGGTSPRGGTGGIQPVDSHQLGHLHHRRPSSASHQADFEDIDLEAQHHHASVHSQSHGHSANGNAISPSTTDGSKVHQTASEAAPQGPVVNESQANETNDQNPDSKPKPNLLVRFALTTRMILLHSKINILLVFVPVGIAVSQVNLSPGIIFAMNAIAIIPLAGLLSHATESVARKFGDATGALLNVTFGNAVELIIFIALAKDEIRIVQASLIGSILANLLLILGMSFLLGGLRFREQLYNSTVTNTSVSLLSLSVSSLLLPTVFYWSFADKDLAKRQSLTISHGTSVLLLLVYGIYLLFQLKSHAYMYESTPQKLIDEESARGPVAQWLASSSSDDDDSSSSSDSDDSNRSRETLSRRVRRAIRGGGRTRKSSVISSDTVAPTPTRTPSFGTGDVVSPLRDETASELTAVRPLSEANEEAIDDGGSHKSSRAKRRHRRHAAGRTRRSKKSKKISSHATDSRDFVPGAETIAEAPEVLQIKQKLPPTGGAGEPRRVDFAVSDAASHREGSMAETQLSAANRFNGLRGISFRPVARSLAPTLFVPTGKEMPMPSLVATGPVPRVRYGIRRTNSLPDRLSSHFHQHHPSTKAMAPSVQLATLTGGATAAAAAAAKEEGHDDNLSRLSAIILLLVSTGLVAVCAEFMVDSINGLVASSSVGEIFIGLIILPIVGNAAEHVTAITVAMKNKMDLAIGVAVGSSIQIALFVTPLIVVIGWAMGKDMSLYFTLFEFACLFVSAFIVNFLVLDGRSNYLEGALLCATYAIIGLVAFYYPNAKDASDWGGA